MRESSSAWRKEPRAWAQLPSWNSSVLSPSQRLKGKENQTWAGVGDFCPGSKKSGPSTFFSSAKAVRSKRPSLSLRGRGSLDETVQGAAQTGANSCHRPGISKRGHWSLAGPYQEGDTVTPSWGRGTQRPREDAPADAGPGGRPHPRTSPLMGQRPSPAHRGPSRPGGCLPSSDAARKVKNKVKTQLRFWLPSGPAPGWEHSPNFP